MAFSLSAFHRILKKAGAERVSDEAAAALKEATEEIAENLAKKIVRVSEHAGRKTILERDVELVTSEEKRG